MMDPERRHPSPQTLTWVGRSVGKRSTVVRVRRLLGGISSSVHAVTIEARDGARHTVVLRRWVGGWVDDDPAVGPELVVTEQHALEAAERSDVPAPRVLAADPKGDESGCASLLMTRLPGHVHLAPRDPERWLREQAEMLPRIHAITPDAPHVSGAPDFDHWEAPRSRRPQIWRAAKDAVSAAPPPTQEVFRHGDYQHFNMLWSRGRLTGVVDWTFPRIGSADRDVGHCRLNLAVLYSADRAERFRALYESAAGRTVDPYWDLVALMRYSDDWTNFIPLQVNGLIPVDNRGMTERVEDLVALTLRRLG